MLIFYKVEVKVKESLVLVKEPVEHENSGWDMVYEDGDMKVSFPFVEQEK